jgi:exonuclease SbcC
MTGDRFNLVELDEDYNLQIMDYGHLFGIERFSGGEKDLANLCLRLAISQALTESAGLDRSFVILDEVFGSQDSDRRSLIFNGLASLKNRFPQILLITHIEEIKDRVETLIQVEPTSGGWSEVRVNGQPA